MLSLVLVSTLQFLTNSFSDALIIDALELKSCSLNQSSTPEMVRSQGYVCDIHNVVTQDGYILTLHRISGGPAGKLNHSLPPVILQHGLLDSSATWCLMGPNRGLAYIMVDKGYDVWLGNARGDKYSRKHKTLSTWDNRFWDFTWDEMGRFDVPAMIDYILEETNHDKVDYVGHSMGTTMFFVMLATRPEYNEKVRLMSALAPVAFMSHATTPLRYLTPFAGGFEVVLNFLGHGEFLPRNELVDVFLKKFCESLKLETIICQNVLFIIGGFDKEDYNKEETDRIFCAAPAGASSKTVVHYAQLIRSGRFRQYDYGTIVNMMNYMSTQPPKYNLSQVNVPVYLYYGEKDELAAPEDVEILSKNLPNLIRMYKYNFNHFTFVWGKDAPNSVYSLILQAMGH